MNEYQAARDALAWTHRRLASTIGVAKRTTYRYATGELIPEPQRRLLRLLVLLRLTVSARKFEEIIKQLD
jgi:ribosome-binding protein aMBF1 (putative translation factor)